MNKTITSLNSTKKFQTSRIRKVSTVLIVCAISLCVFPPQSQAVDEKKYNPQVTQNSISFSRLNESNEVKSNILTLQDEQDMLVFKINKRKDGKYEGLQVFINFIETEESVDKAITGKYIPLNEYKSNDANYYNFSLEGIKKYRISIVFPDTSLIREFLCEKAASHMSFITTKPKENHTRDYVKPKLLEKISCDMSNYIISRESLGFANISFPTSPKAPSHKWKNIVIDKAVNGLSYSDQNDPRAKLVSLQKSLDMMETDFRAHFFVDNFGNIYEGIAMNKEKYLLDIIDSLYDQDSIVISLLGSLEQELSKDMLISLQNLISHLKVKYSISLSEYSGQNFSSDLPELAKDSVKKIFEKITSTLPINYPMDKCKDGDDQYFGQPVDGFEYIKNSLARESNIAQKQANMSSSNSDKDILLRSTKNKNNASHEEIPAPEKPQVEPKLVKHFVYRQTLEKPEIKKIISRSVPQMPEHRAVSSTNLGSNMLSNPKLLSETAKYPNLKPISIPLLDSTNNFSDKISSYDMNSSYVSSNEDVLLQNKPDDTYLNLNITKEADPQKLSMQPALANTGVNFLFIVTLFSALFAIFVGSYIVFTKRKN